MASDHSESPGDHTETTPEPRSTDHSRPASQLDVSKIAAPSAGSVDSEGLHSPAKKPPGSSVSARPGIKSPPRGGPVQDGSLPRAGASPSRGSQGTGGARPPTNTSRLTQPTASSAARAGAGAASKQQPPAATTSSRSSQVSSVRGSGTGTGTRPGHARSGSTTGSRSGIISPPTQTSRVTSPVRKAAGGPTATSGARPAVAAKPGMTLAARAGTVSPRAVNAVNDEKVTVSELTTELAEKQADLEKLRERIVRLEGDLSARDAMIEEAMGRVQQLERRSGEFNDLRARYDDQSEAQTTLQEKIRELTLRMAESGTLAEARLSEIHRHEGRISALERERDDLAAQVANEKSHAAENDAIRENHSTQLSILQAEIDAHGAVVEELATLRSQSADHHAAWSVSQSEITRLQAEVGDLAAVRDELVQTHSERQDLASRLQQISSDAERAHLQVGEREAEVLRLQKALENQTQSSSTALNVEVDRLSAEIARLTTELDQAKIESLEYRQRESASIEAATAATEKVARAYEEGRRGALEEAAKISAEKDAALREEVGAAAALKRATALEELKLDFERRAEEERHAHQDQLRTAEQGHHQAMLDSQSQLKAAEERFTTFRAETHASSAQIQQEQVAALQEAYERAKREFEAAGNLRQQQDDESSQAAVQERETRLKTMEDQLIKNHQLLDAREMEIKGRTEGLKEEESQLVKRSEQLQKGFDELAAKLSMHEGDAETINALRADLQARQHALESTQQNFAQLTDSIQQEHNIEMDRREGIHKKTIFALHLQIEDLQDNLAALRQAAPVHRSTVPLDTSLTDLHRAHASKLGEIERQYANNIAILRAELDRAKQELQKAQMLKSEG